MVAIEGGVGCGGGVGATPKFENNWVVGGRGGGGETRACNACGHFTLRSVHPGSFHPESFHPDGCFTMRAFHPGGRVTLMFWRSVSHPLNVSPQTCHSRMFNRCPHDTQTNKDKLNTKMWWFAMCNVHIVCLCNQKRGQIANQKMQTAVFWYFLA